MILELNGNEILSEKDFHKALKSCEKFPSHYGENLDALWDSLTGDVTPPFKILWKNSKISRAHIARFDTLVKIMREVEKQDLEKGWVERFELELL